MRISPSDAEWGASAFSSTTLERASSCMRTQGVVILEDILNPALILEAKEIFFKRFERHFDGKKHEGASEVGDRRILVPINLEWPFDRRELVANSWILSMLSAAFESDFVLGAYGVVCSLPGAAKQHIHIDGGDLFPQAGLNRLIPIVAVTVAIPLLEMNDINGTTALWPGSHRDETLESAALKDEGGEEPQVREGSCMLWDYRLRHAGTPNRGAVPRPLLYMTYCREWFVDHKNYRHQCLRAPKDFQAKLPEDLRRMFARAQEQPGAG